MRKIILPLVIGLALVASIGAAGYTAQVTMDIDPEFGDTKDAELAFESVGGDVADNFLFGYDTGGGCYQIGLDFGNFQPDSVYFYEEVLYVTNMKDYDVTLTVSDVSGGLKTLLDNKDAVLTLYGRHSGNPGNVPPSVIIPLPNVRGSLYAEYAWGGYADCMYDSGYGIGVAPAWKPQTLKAYPTFLNYPGDWNSCRIYLSFRLATGPSCPSGLSTGSITFKAVD